MLLTCVSSFIHDDETGANKHGRFHWLIRRALAFGQCKVEMETLATL